MNIEIKPYQNDLRKGRKAIIVDGVRWGVIEMDSHGVHGASYWFRQEGGQAIYEPCKDFHGNPSARMVKVWGDKHHRHDPTPAFPFPERLAATVQMLIDRQLLRHPDIVRALSAEFHRQENEKRKQAERAEEEAWKEVAVKAFEQRNVTAIIEAMKWAQTR